MEAHFGSRFLQTYASSFCKAMGKVTLHYNRPLHHAQHYLGSCDDPQRIQDDGNGTSRARLPQVLCQLGAQFVVARTWEGRTGERKLKNQKNARLLCPISRAAKLRTRPRQERDRRTQGKPPFPDATTSTALPAYRLQGFI